MTPRMARPPSPGTGERAIETVNGAPTRVPSTTTFSPARRSSSTRSSISRELTGMPSTEVMMSPGRNASEATVPSSASSTRTPVPTASRQPPSSGKTLSMSAGLTTSGTTSTGTPTGGKLGRWLGAGRDHQGQGHERDAYTVTHHAQKGAANPAIRAGTRDHGARWSVAIPGWRLSTANTYSSTVRPPTRCSRTIRSSTSPATEWYHTPSG